MQQPLYQGRSLLYTSLVSYAIIALAVWLIRDELIHFRVGFILILLASIAGLWAGVLSFRAAVNSQSREKGLSRATWLSLVLGPLPVAVLLVQIIRASNHPVIHDISTDTNQPPELRTAMLLRQASDHSISYDPANAEIQQLAYPDLRSVTSPLSPAELSKLIKRYMLNHGWEIVSPKNDNDLIEAVVTSALFRFEDDLVVRLTPSAMGTKVDIRSASRVGKSDLGANAQRIRLLISFIEQQS